MQQILILGGTGFVGRSLCEALAARHPGLHIVVPSRQPANARRLWHVPAMRVVRADVHDPAQLDALLPQCDAVVNLVAILHGTQAEFQRVHVELPRRLAEACARHGVRRLVHVSALGADPAAPSRYQRSKAAGEAVLRAAPLALTVLRPSVIFGAGDSFLNLFARLQAWLPVMPLAGADARFQPVWVGDVAQAIERCLLGPQAGATIGATYECTGPTVYTLRRLVQLAGAWSGHRRAVIGLPNALGRAQAMLMEWLPGEPLMSRDNIDSMRVDNVASGRDPGLGALGIEAQPLEAIAPAYLRRA